MSGMRNHVDYPQQHIIASHPYAPHIASSQANIVGLNETYTTF